MSLYARIDAGLVAELLDTQADIATLFSPELLWAPCGPEVLRGWIYSNGSFAQPSPVVDWQGGALLDLRTRRDRLLDVVSGMQADYLTAGDNVNAGLCLIAKQGMKDITSFQPLIDSLGQPTRDAFDIAAVTRWKQIAAPASPEVRAEFARYATKA